MKHLKQKYAGLSFAEAATKIGSKYPKRDLDLTAKKSYEMEMAELMRMNESAKVLSEVESNVKEILKCGGKVKMANGGPFEDVPAGNTNWMAQQSGDPLIPQLGNPLSALAVPSKTAGNMVSFQVPQLFKPDASALEGPLGFERKPANQTSIVQPLTRNTSPDILSEMKQGQTFNEPNTTPVKDRDGNWLQKTFGEEGNVYTPALLGSAANLGINAAILAGGYDKVAPNNNKYEDEVRTTMQDRNIDMTAVQDRIQGAFNAGRENLKNARSANVRNAFDQNLAIGAMQQTADASLQEQQMNNQYKGDYANVINNLGMQDVQARNLSDELTARNKGQFQSNLSQFGANVAENSKFFTKLKANDKMNSMYLDIINQTSNDFQIDPDLLGKLKQGKFSDISEGQWLQLKKSDNTAVKAFADFYQKQK